MIEVLVISQSVMPAVTVCCHRDSARGLAVEERGPNGCLRVKCLKHSHHCNWRGLFVASWHLYEHHLSAPALETPAPLHLLSRSEALRMFPIGFVSEKHFATTPDLRDRCTIPVAVLEDALLDQHGAAEAERSPVPRLKDSISVLRVFGWGVDYGDRKRILHLRLGRRLRG